MERDRMQHGKTHDRWDRDSLEKDKQKNGINDAN